MADNCANACPGHMICQLCGSSPELVDSFRAAGVAPFIPGHGLKCCERAHEIGSFWDIVDEDTPAERWRLFHKSAAARLETVMG